MTPAGSTVIIALAETSLPPPIQSCTVRCGCAASATLCCCLTLAIQVHTLLSPPNHHPHHPYPTHTRLHPALKPTTIAWHNTRATHLEVGVATGVSIHRHQTVTHGDAAVTHSPRRRSGDDDAWRAIPSKRQLHAHVLAARGNSDAPSRLVHRRQPDGDLGYLVERDHPAQPTVARQPRVATRGSSMIAVGPSWDTVAAGVR